MPCGWEGNRRSAVALAMRHRLQWFIHLWAHGLRKRDEHPTYTPRGISHTTFTTLHYLFPPVSSASCPRLCSPVPFLGARWVWQCCRFLLRLGVVYGSRFILHCRHVAVHSFGQLVTRLKSSRHAVTIWPCDEMTGSQFDMQRCTCVTLHFANAKLYLDRCILSRASGRTLRHRRASQNLTDLSMFRL